jgi:hypothetical protein
LQAGSPLELSFAIRCQGTYAYWGQYQQLDALLYDHRMMETVIGELQQAEQLFAYYGTYAASSDKRI